MQYLRPLKNDELVAVTITTKNRPHYLAVLLANLVQQTYTSWMLVINDSSDQPVIEQQLIKDLLTVLRTAGKEVRVIHTPTSQDRHQRAMETVPEGIEFIHRIDDDMLLRPDFLEQIQKPFSFFPNRPIAATGGCLAIPHYQPIKLDKALRQPNWFPRIDKPDWHLQGHPYQDREVVEMESLCGIAMCYRRSAVEQVGGWEIPGQSPQIFREESDMSARLVLAGYELLLTTAAAGWHLVAPSGGSREVTRNDNGTIAFDSHRDEFLADDALFKRRVEAMLAGGYRREHFARYLIADLENGQIRPRPLRRRRDEIYYRLMSALPEPVLRLWRWFWQNFLDR